LSLISPDLYITSTGRVARVLEKKTRHSTCQRQALGAETRNRTTGVSVQAELRWRLGGLVCLAGRSQVWTPLLTAGRTYQL